MRRWSPLLLLAALLTGGLAPACASAPPGPLSPLVVGWERYLKIEWEAVPAEGRPTLNGYVINDWGVPAGRIRLLAETLDAEGRILAQEVTWLLPRVLMPGTRAYFEIPAPRAGPAYRVSVFSFDWIDVDRRRPWLW